MSDIKQAYGDEYKKILLLEADELHRVIPLFNFDQIESVAKLLLECGPSSVFTTGAGTSGYVAGKIAHTLNCVGRPAHFISPVDAFHGGSGVIRSGDILLMFSKGGETDELIRLISVAKKRGCSVIAVTEVVTSTIAQKADLVLQLPKVQEADKYGCIATTSILVVLSIFDAIAMILMDRLGYSLDSFAATHPGGAVGKRLGQTITSE